MNPTNAKPTAPGAPQHRREPIHPDDVESGITQPRDSDDVMEQRKPGSGTIEHRDDQQPRNSGKPLAEKAPGTSA